LAQDCGHVASQGLRPGSDELWREHQRG